MRGRGALTLCAALSGVAAVFAGGDSNAAGSQQALRTCVDRWNADTMTGWGSMSVRISIRGLNARERAAVSFGDDAQRRCTVSLADRPGDNTWICRIGATGGYECPLVTSDGMPPLQHANGRTDRRGVLRLDIPLKGTHATPPLAWQRRYPHVDGYILPWTRTGKLRAGLGFDGAGRGACGVFLEHEVPRSAVRCVDRRTAAYTEPCFPQRRDFRAGDVAACGTPGSTTFVRWSITGRF